MIQKRFALRLFFLVEIILFACVYYYGARGVQIVGEIKRENEAIAKEIRALSNDLDLLEKKIVAWNEDSFYAEKIAREELHMARRDEEIYLLD